MAARLRAGRHSRPPTSRCCPRAAQGQPGGAAARHRRAQAAAPSRAPRRGARPSRGLATSIRSSCTEADGYFRGRGVIDDKAMAAIFVANMIGYARAGLPARPRHHRRAHDRRGAVGSPHNGVRWLLQHHRDLIDAEFALNEGGGGALRNGKPFRLAVQLAEKVYQTYQLEVTESRRPQRRPAPRQPDLPPRRRPCTASRSSIFRRGSTP